MPAYERKFRFALLLLFLSAGFAACAPRVEPRVVANDQRFIIVGDGRFHMVTQTEDGRLDAEALARIGCDDSPCGISRVGVTFGVIKYSAEPSPQPPLRKAFVERDPR